MSVLNQYQVGGANWRKQLQLNRSRTRLVITMFIALYLIVGVIIDTLIYMELYQAPISSVLYALFTLQVFPYATLTMVGVTIISLLITFSMHNKIMLLGTNSHEVTATNARDINEKQLYNVIEEMKVAAGLKFMPRVYIIEAEYMNAFASGYSEKSAMVAITRGLLTKLDRSELQAVMAHELSHIRHQDIKLTMTASVLSTILLIAIDILFYNLIFGSRRKMDARVAFVIIALRYLLPVITALLMLYLSRTREYMADSGCVELMRDNQPLARALIKIHQDHQQNLPKYRQAYGNTAHEDVRRAAYLYDPVKTGVEPTKSLFSAFSTHPSLEQRLKAIGIVANDSK